LWHAVVGDASFYELLYRMDEEIAAKARQAGCGHCGGRLDSARYRRKPRGTSLDLGPTYERRLSFCCDACRRRTTPRSVRFLGRRVYLGAMVIVAAALRQGVTPVRASKLGELVGVDRRTLMRWRRWWLERMPRTDFWKRARGSFDRPVDERGLPGCLLERFTGAPREALVATLRFLSPLGTSDALI
jgi:hypothetical protein